MHSLLLVRISGHLSYNRDDHRPCKVSGILTDALTARLLVSRIKEGLAIAVLMGCGTVSVDWLSMHFSNLQSRSR